MEVAAVYAAFAVTASYTLLMLLLWLYDRSSPARRGLGRPPALRDKVD